MVEQAAGEGRPLIQIDCGGRFVCLLRGEEEAATLAGNLALDLGLDLLSSSSMPGICSQGERGTIRRILSSVFPGELISVNGTVVGRAIESRVEIEARRGKIIEIKGAALKQHGLDKLGCIDLRRAIIRSGSIRRTASPSGGDGEEGSAGIDDHKEVVAAFIDHCAEDAFEAALGAGMAVTVGDDTTAIAGDILSRQGTMVMGIVDGDLDCLGGGMATVPGSIIFRVEPGYDDVVGRLVKARIFQGAERITTAPAELAEKIAAAAGSRLMETERLRPVKPDRDRL